MNNFKPVISLEPVGRRRQGLYADTQVPVLHVPAGDKGGLGGLPSLLKEEKEEDEEEKEEDEEEKKKDNDEEGEIKRKRRDEKEMQDSLVVEEGIMVKFSFVPFHFVSFPCSSCLKVLSAKKKLNNHIIEMHKDPSS